MRARTGINDDRLRSGQRHHPRSQEKTMPDHDETRLLGTERLNRRGMLKCMAWTGTGVVWGLSGGIPRTIGLLGSAEAAQRAPGELTFVQISDSHIGFHLPPNPDPTATLGEAIAKIKAMRAPPAF